MCADDLVCVLLGCKSPLVVRKTSREQRLTAVPTNNHRSSISPTYLDDCGDRYEIVGECYVDGLDNMSCLFGRLPDGWTSQFDRMKSGYGATHAYLHRDGKITKWHPLLEELPKEWMPYERERRPEDPSTFTCFWNTKTGEERNSDPRLTAARLLARGVEIRSFVFV